MIWICSKGVLKCKGGNPLNYGGYEKSAIGGQIWGGGFKGANLTKISCEIFWLFTEMVPVLFVIFYTYLQ